MNLKKKLFTIFSSAASVTAAIAIMNKIIFHHAKKNIELPTSRRIYHWRLGDISYTCTGTGHPILLIHSLDNTSSSYEWDNIIAELSKTRTVYALDLLGCGFSEKPDFTYANFVFVQLINDFITTIIGGRTDVVTLGNSSSLVLTSCVYNKTLFNKIMLINPDPISECNKMPDKIRRFHSFCYNLPIYGTFAYNIISSRIMIQRKLNKRRVQLDTIHSAHIQKLYEMAHIGGYHAKYLYSSLCGKYMGISVEGILRKIDNNICILGGESVPEIHRITRQYQEINPTIEVCIAENCKYDIPQENPQAILDMISYI